MVQQIEFIIHTTIQPLTATFLPKVIGQGQRFKKILVNANLNNNYWISPFFYVKLPIRRIVLDL